MLVYAFVAVAVVADEHLVVSLETLCVRWGVREDVAGASFMAFGSAAPEIIINAISTLKAVRQDEHQPAHTHYMAERRPYASDPCALTWPSRCCQPQRSSPESHPSTGIGQRTCRIGGGARVLMQQRGRWRRRWRRRGHHSRDWRNPRQWNDSVCTEPRPGEEPARKRASALQRSSAVCMHCVRVCCAAMQIHIHSWLLRPCGLKAAGA